MKRLILISAALFTVIGMSAPAVANPKLEVAFNLTPTIIFDDTFEFFADDNLVMTSYGMDMRVDVVQFKDSIHLLPFVAYRFAKNDGMPILADDYMDTYLRTQDLYGGVRVRGWFLPWLGGFAQAAGGVSWLYMKGTLYDQGQEGMKDTYIDKKAKWRVSGLMGAEFRISPKFLEKKGITRFNVGGELGIGFVKRGQTKFAPELSGGDDLSIDVTQTTNFGDIDLSGITFQLGVTFRFF